MRRKDIERTRTQLAAIPDDEERLLLATGRYIGEGFDDARLDTLFLTLPISWRGTIAQYVGRLHRLHDGKREVRVYDYADFDVPMLSRMFDRRCKGYEAVGYTIQLPASAVPGWPPSVSLPVIPNGRPNTRLRYGGWFSMASTLRWRTSLPRWPTVPRRASRALIALGARVNYFCFAGLKLYPKRPAGSG